MKIPEELASERAGFGDSDEVKSFACSFLYPRLASPWVRLRSEGNIQMVTCSSGLTYPFSNIHLNRYTSLSPECTKISAQSLHRLQNVPLESHAYPEPISGQQCADWLNLSGSRDIPKTHPPKGGVWQGLSLPGGLSFRYQKTSDWVLGLYPLQRTTQCVCAHILFWLPAS